MGFWAWFIIWGAIVAATIYTFAYIGLMLLRQGKALKAELDKLQPQLEALQKAAESIAEMPEIESNLLDSPVATLMNRLSIIRRRRKKHDDRQHMLVARLKRIKPNESRFK